jgi:ADP-ribosyl-[dinitrogen reductase] hydrolase
MENRMIVDDALRDRYRGVLLGKAIGDALGATVEFMSRSAIQEQYGELRDIIGGGWLTLPAGEITDDTQMAICIARSIVDRKGFDAEDISRHFVAWYRSNPPDIGNTTVHALRQLAEGVPWQEAGKNTHEAMRPRDASNGSVMRSAPVAMLERLNPDLNRHHSVDSSRITHANPLCTEGCVVLNAAIATLLNEPNSDPVAVASSVAASAEMLNALDAVAGHSADTLNAGGYVLDTLQAAFWAVTRHNTLEDAVIAAVNLGQDADTTGAVAGALAGAKWGASAIPQRWLDVLLARDELIDLADGILDLAG